MPVTNIFAPNTRARSAEVNQNFDDVESGIALDNITNNIVFTNNIGIYFENASGSNDCRIYETTANDLVLQVGTAGQQIVMQDNTGTVCFAFNTSTAAINFTNGYDLRAYDSTNTDYIAVYDNGTQSVLYSNTNPIVIDSGSTYIETDNIRIINGQTLRLYNSTNAYYVELYHDGSNAFINTGIGRINMEDGVGILGGNSLRLYNSTGTSYIELYHDGTYPRINTSTGTPYININESVGITGGNTLRTHSPSGENYISYSCGDSGEISVGIYGTAITQRYIDFDVMEAIQVPRHAGNPDNLTLANGMIWYDTTLNLFRCYQNGAVVNLV